MANCVYNLITDALYFAVLIVFFCNLCFRQHSSRSGDRMRVADRCKTLYHKHVVLGQGVGSGHGQQPVSYTHLNYSSLAIL